jgi:type IV pilus assembly protein PilA
MKRFALPLAVFATLALAASAGGSTTTRQDSKATSNARNFVSMVESCFTETEDYSKCRTKSQLESGMMGMPSVPIGSHAGQVHVSKATKLSYTVDSYSRSGTHFLVVHKSDGFATRKCTRPGKGLCKKNGTW